MLKKILLLFLALGILSSCAPAQKSPRSAKKLPSKNPKIVKPYAYWSGENDAVANQESIEDLIYGELSKRQQALIKKYRVPSDTHSLGGVKFDIPVITNDRVNYWIDYFVNGSGRKHYARYLARSTRFVPTELRILKENGVPKDLIFLSMMESGFNTHAYSSAAASGLWQFIRSTGRLYGLDSDYWIDERRDPEKASLAAARHLRDLYQEFGDWYLAFAAYNAGAGKVKRAIDGVGSRNFWDLAASNYLRQETKDYVPKILAAAIIGKSLDKYGFDSVEFQDPIAIERASLSTPGDVETIAECAGVDGDMIRLINPELLRSMTPPNRSQYSIYVPRGTGATFERRFAALSAEERLKNVRYAARRGESLKAIALNKGVSVSNLVSANPFLSGRSTVPSNSTLLVPKTYDAPPALVANYPVASRGTKLADLIAERTDLDVKTKKRGVKKEKVAKALKDQDTTPDGEMKVGWKESSEGLIKKEISSEEKVLATAGVIPSGAGSSPSFNSNTMALNSEDGASAADPSLAAESQPEAQAAPSNEAQITAALSKVKTDETISDPVPNETAEGAVAIKTSGQEPSLPKSADKKKKTELARESVVRYKVKRGEHLTMLAARYGVTLDQLREWNHLDPKRELWVNQVLLIKKGGEKSENKIVSLEKEKVQASHSDSNKLKKNTKSSTTKVVSYKVKQGDTLTKIAKKYDVSPAEILSSNRLTKKSPIRPGLVLRIKTRAGNSVNEG